MPATPTLEYLSRLVSLCLLLAASILGAQDHDRFAEERGKLATGTSPEKVQVIDNLLGTGDLQALSILRDALSGEDRELRIRITTGIFRVFPLEAPELFFSLVDDSNLYRREAALFAIATLDDPRVLPILIAALDSKEKTLGEAAARALAGRGREAFNAAYTRAYGGGRPISPTLRKILAETRIAVFSEVIRSGADDVRRALRDRFADASGARRLREAYRDAHLDDPAAAKLVVLGMRLAPWCPRASLLPGTHLGYTIQLGNVFVGSEKKVEISVDDIDFSAMHFWRYSLDRAVTLLLPLDELFLDPSCCAPTWIDGEEPGTSPILSYRLPERTKLACGIGILNIAFWQGSTHEGRDVLLTLDKATGLPREERVTDVAGELVMSVEYGGWLDLPGGASAPSTIRVDLPRATIGANVVRMRYELRFQIIEGVWILEKADAVALVEEGEELRATASLSSISVTRKEPDSAAPPSGEPEGATGGSAPVPESGGGERTGESGGHGTIGGSPRS